MRRVPKTTMVQSTLWFGLVGVPGSVVLFKAKHLLKRNTVFPPCSFKVRLQCELVDIAEAKVGHGDYVRWDAQHQPKRLPIENAHPPNPNTFCACSEPKVLNGTDCRINGGFWHRMTAKPMAAFALWIA